MRKLIAVSVLFLMFSISTIMYLYNKDINANVVMDIQEDEIYELNSKINDLENKIVDLEISAMEANSDILNIQDKINETNLILQNNETGYYDYNIDYETFDIMVGVMGFNEVYLLYDLGFEDLQRLVDEGKLRETDLDIYTFIDFYPEKANENFYELSQLFDRNDVKLVVGLFEDTEGLTKVRRETGVMVMGKQPGSRGP